MKWIQGVTEMLVVMSVFWLCLIPVACFTSAIEILVDYINKKTDWRKKW